MTKPTPAHLCTSFQRLRQAGACVSGYGTLANYIRDKHAVTPKDYGMDRPIPVTEVLKAVGLSDTIWVLNNAVLDDSDKAKRVLRLAACLFAEHVLPIFEQKYPDDQRPRRAIEVARAYANGEATAEDIAQARRAAYATAATAYATAYAATAAATTAAATAATAAYAAADAADAATATDATTAAYAAAYAAATAAATTAAAAAAAYADAAAYAAYADAAYATDAADRLTEQQWQLTALTNLLNFEADQCATTFSEGSALDDFSDVVQ